MIMEGTMKRIPKGTNGYIKSTKLWQLLYVLLIIAIAVALFTIGYITTGTSRNLLTVVAVLAVLPGTKALIRLMLFLPHRTFSSERFEALKAISPENAHLYSDLVFTSTEHVMHLDFLCVCGKECVAYVDDSDDKNGKKHNKKYIVDYFTESLKNDGVLIHMHVFNNLQELERRLNSLANSENALEQEPEELARFIRMILV